MEQKKLLKISVNKKKLTDLKENYPIWFFSLISFFLIFLTSLLIFLNWRQFPPQIPLFFSRPWGEKQLSSPLGLWLLPSFALLALILNLFLSISVFKKETFIKQLLTAATLVTGSLYLITAYKIITLVI